jgi:hypothetical protein
MKISKLFTVLLILIPFLQSCQDDISDLGDPRDAVAKLWRVTDNTGTYAGTNGYDVTISKDAKDITKILIDNFHGEGTSNKLVATLAGKNITIVTGQKLDGSINFEGTGTISSDLKRITFNYTVKYGNDPVEGPWTATFAPPNVTKKKVEVPL